MRGFASTRSTFELPENKKNICFSKKKKFAFRRGTYLLPCCPSRKEIRYYLGPWEAQICFCVKHEKRNYGSTRSKSWKHIFASARSTTVLLGMEKKVKNYNNASSAFFYILFLLLFFLVVGSFWFAFLSVFHIVFLIFFWFSWLFGFFVKNSSSKPINNDMVLKISTWDM